MPDLNTVVITGNLTRDPELRQAGSTNVCRLRVAVNERVRNSATGEWGDRPNYFDVTVWGAPGRELPPPPEQGPRRRRRRAPALA